MMTHALKITTTRAADKTPPTLFLAADVSRLKLNLFCRFEADAQTHVLEDEVRNQTRHIEAALTQLQQVADTHDFTSLCVVCEASGGYEKLLLSTAERLGLQTALVSGEQVGAKLVSLATTKTDKKGARVIHLAAASGKLQQHRRLPERYLLLRRLTAFYDDEVHLMAALRTRLLRILRSRVRGVKAVTAAHLLRAAEASARTNVPEAVAAALSRRLTVLMAELEQHERHAGELREQIETLGAELKAQGELPAIDEAVSGLTLFNLARLVGQTGPLADFSSKRQLLRYAGMNLRERERLVQGADAALEEGQAAAAQGARTDGVSTAAKRSPARHALRRAAAANAGA